ncbi:MAG: hypothetical protein ACYSR0_00375 [Planctomycetota bacterium]|jgi:hypothetical protein
MHDDYERSIIEHIQIEAHGDEDKLNIMLNIRIIGANWYLYEELMGTFRLQKNVSVGMEIEE